MRTATKNQNIKKTIKPITKKVTNQKEISAPPKTKEAKSLSPIVAITAIPSDHPQSKQSQLISLLRQPGGSDITQLMQATGWQAHSIRGVISGVIRKRLGLKVLSNKVDGAHRYRIEVQ